MKHSTLKLILFPQGWQLTLPRLPSGIMQLLTVLLLSFFVKANSPYKILGILPHTGKSHFIFFEPLMKALAKKGHRVTILSHFPQKQPFDNYIDVPLSNESFAPSRDMQNLYSGRLQNYYSPFVLIFSALKTCPEGLKNPNVQSLIESGQKFDLILAEFFNTRCFLSLIKSFKAPLIGLSSSMLQPYLDKSMGHPSNPSFIPNIFMPCSDRMNFLERFENTLYYFYTDFLFNTLVSFFDDWVAQKFVARNLPPLRDFMANASLMILNSHFTLTRPRPLPPGFIEVSGLHLQEVEELPKVSTLVNKLFKI